MNKFAIAVVAVALGGTLAAGAVAPAHAAADEEISTQDAWVMKTTVANKTSYELDLIASTNAATAPGNIPASSEGYINTTDTGYRWNSHDSSTTYAIVGTPYSAVIRTDPKHMGGPDLRTCHIQSRGQVVHPDDIDCASYGNTVYLGTPAVYRVSAHQWWGRMEADRSEQKQGVAWAEDLVTSGNRVSGLIATIEGAPAQPAYHGNAATFGFGYAYRSFNIAPDGTLPTGWNQNPYGPLDDQLWVERVS